MTSVVGQAAVITLAGIGIGIASAFAAARSIAALVVGISPHDPLTFLIVLLALAVVALPTALVPTRRAARVDPIEALRTL